MTSLDVLKELFTSACSQQHEIARHADVQLNRLCTESGFYPAVVKIATNRTLDAGTRLQAILFLKNAIDAIWRKYPSSSFLPPETNRTMIPQEERREIRSMLLHSYNDESSQIGLHLAIVISKIARFDCPHNWPALIPELAFTIDRAVEVPDPTAHIAHERALFILYHVVKTMASKRLAHDKRTFHQLCEQVVNPVFFYWKAHLNQVNVSVVSSSSAMLCLKSLRYMVIYGFSDPGSHSSVNEFLSTLSASVQLVVQMLTTPTGNDEIKTNMEKIVLVALKLIGEFQEHSALDFVHWMVSYLELAGVCAFGSYSVVLPPLAHVRAMNILKLVLLCQDYRITEKSETASNTDSALTQAVEASMAFFSVERAREFCRILVERYLVLSAEELDAWLDEPETYATTDDTEAWRLMIRPAAESFLVALVHERWEQIGPLANQWFQISLTPINFQNLDEVLARDSVLTAIGLAAVDLSEEVDFESLFVNVCLPLMITPCTMETQRILVRRVIWLCGKWIDVKFSNELRPKFYEAVIRLVGKADEDMVVRLTSCNALKRALDEYEFEMDAFRPFLKDTVTALISLLTSCREAASQLYVVTTLWLLAERAGSELTESLDPIIAYVPQLWQSENAMLKGQILNLFTQLVKGLGKNCIALLDGLSIMLSTALNTEDAAHVYLMEDGLDLWLALVENCESPLPPQLLALFRFMPGLLTVQSENLRVCCDVVKSYCVYWDAGFAQAYLPELGKIFRSVIEEMRSEGIVCILKVIEMILRCFGKDALGPMSDNIIWCIETIVQSKETMSVRLMCAAIISLVSIQNAEQFFGVLASVMNEEQIIAFVKKWVELIGMISHDLQRRKANALGLCAWLTLPTRCLDPIFADMVAMLADVFNDVCIEENGEYVDSLLAYDFGVCVGGTDDNTGFPETEHDKRSQRLRDFDPVYNSPLQKNVLNALDSRKQICGAEAFDALWSTVDRGIVESLKKYCASSS